MTNFHSKKKAREQYSLRLIFTLILVTASVAYANPPSLPCPEEKSSADISLRRIENEWPLRGHIDLISQYVQRLGVSLAQLTREGRYVDWHFFVVRNFAPNAFSIGNGYVFVTEGAINLAQNESELAAILAHELGHELAGHFCQPAPPDPFRGFFDLFNIPKSQSYRAGVGSMTQIIDPIKERQADQIALSILQSAGFDPHAMLAITKRFPVHNQVHSMDTDRLQALSYNIQQMLPVFAGSSADFMEIKRLLAVESSAW